METWEGRNVSLCYRPKSPSETDRYEHTAAAEYRLEVQVVSPFVEFAKKRLQMSYSNDESTVNFMQNGYTQRISV